MSQMVRFVRKVSENDVEVITSVDPMTWEQAIAELREIDRVAPQRLDEFDLVYVDKQGNPTRYASWAI